MGDYTSDPVVVALIAGMLSTIDFQPSQHHPELMLPIARAALALPEGERE